MTDRQPNLDKLPTEILDMVIERCDPESLKSLRLVSHRLSNVSSKPFGDQWLAHRRFIFTPYSLQGFVDLSAHPVLGPCVRTVQFGTCRVEGNSMAVMDALRARKIDADSLILEYLCHYDRAAKVQSNLIESGNHVNLLADALANLKK